MQERENRELERAKAKQEARLKKQKQENNPDEQIQINFGGHIIEEESPKKLKKFKHDKDDLIPLGMKKPKKAKKEIGYMPEGVPLYTDLTVKEFVSYMAQIKKVDRKIRKEQIEKTIEETGLKDVEKKLIKNLSRGY